MTNYINYVCDSVCSSSIYLNNAIICHILLCCKLYGIHCTLYHSIICSV